MARGMNIMVEAPRPSLRRWATALTGYSTPEGGLFERAANGAMRWLNGVRFEPFGCDAHTVKAPFDPCTTNALPDANEHGFEDEVAFEPFLALAGIECSVVATDRSQLLDWVTAHTEIERSANLAAEVERAAWSGTNISLISAAVSNGETGDNADTSLAGAVSYIEARLAERLHGGVGIIHMPAWLLVLLPNVRWIDDKPHTATGHVIVADAGYQGVDPDTGDASADATWIFGSGPVFAKLSPVIDFVGNPYEEIDFERDQRFVTIQQYGLAYFDPCTVVSAQVDLTDDNIVENPAAGGGGGDATAANQVTANTRLQEIEDRIANIETSAVALEDALTADAATLSNVGDSASSVTLAASNAARRGLIIHNDSGANLFIKFGATASATSYTYKIPPDGHLDYTSGGVIYTGVVDGIWASDAGGNARVTELT